MGNFDPLNTTNQKNEQFVQSNQSILPNQSLSTMYSTTNSNYNPIQQSSWNAFENKPLMYPGKFFFKIN